MFKMPKMALKFYEIDPWSMNNDNYLLFIFQCLIDADLQKF